MKRVSEKNKTKNKKHTIGTVLISNDKTIVNSSINNKLISRPQLNVVLSNDRKEDLN